MKNTRDKPSEASPAASAARPLPPCIAILGPTCSWKSDVGLHVAQAVGGELISCDSMQVYRGLDIGTAKPTLETRRRVRHHLVDILDIESPYSAGAFVEQAEQVLADLRERQRPGILVGGTGLYARALIYGFRTQPADWSTAREIWAQYETAGGPEQLRAELAAADPASTALSEPNPRRLMRAVAVLRITGKPPVAEPRELRHGTPKPGFAQWIILPTLAVLRPRIADRTRAMLAAGWVEETRRLVASGLMQTATARQALGYREIAEFLAGGGSEPDRETLAVKLAQRTVAYARRQRTWFRHQHPGSRIIEVSAPATTSRELADTILRDLGSLTVSHA